MRGKVIDYSVQTNTGVISGSDGKHYQFSGSNWKVAQAPTIGMDVDFQAAGDEAVSIYADLTAATSTATTGGKSKVTAGILAILLGGFGIHKFYLGYIGAGLVFLIVNTIGWAITWLLAFIPNWVLGLIAFVEGILYLTKSDEEFHKTYVEGRKPWF